MLQAEQVLQERYQLKQKLGQNAGRQTWLAQDLGESPAQLVIVKLLAFNPQMHWDELKLFEREAQVLKHLNHPRIPQYRDYFSLDRQIGAGLPWFGLVQEYIPGDSLQQLLDRGQRFTEKQARKIATGVLEILIYLHELSPPVFHRDIKPSNLILGKNGQVHLVDFGAVQDRATAEGVTFTVVGTSGYAPPEQLWGRAVPASDLYALGATLIHLLTGKAPADLPQHRMRIQFTNHVSLKPSFAQWLEKLTEPAPERRINTARQALETLLTGRIATASNEKTSELASSSVRYGRLASLGLLQVIAFWAAYAVIWPAFRLQGDHAEQSKARHRVAAMNRAQQAYHLKTKTFSDSVFELGLRLPPQTENYQYAVLATPNAVFNYGIAQKHNLKNYVGAIFVPTSPNHSPVNNDESGLLMIECEAIIPGTSQPAEPIYENGHLTCSPGTTEISRGINYR